MWRWSRADRAKIRENDYDISYFGQNKRTGLILNLYAYLLKVMHLPADPSPFPFLFAKIKTNLKK